MPTTPATCPLDCPDACGVLVETTEDREFVRLRGNPDHSYSRGSLCGKTALYGELVTSEKRLLKPLVRERGVLREASWDDATDLIARRVKGLEGSRVLGLDYGGNMGTIAKRFPRRILNAIGAANHDAGICDLTSTIGYECVLGHVIGADIERVEEADFLLIWGADIARTVQHMQPAVQRMCKRGTPVVAIDVYRTETITRIEKWGGRGLVVAPGSDAALALALIRQLFENGHADRDFLAQECVGADAFEEHVRGAHDPKWACAKAGIELGKLTRLTDELVRAERPFIKVGVGWTRRRNGVMGMRALCSLAAVRGCVDRFHYESFEHFALDTDVIDRPDLAPEPTRIIHHAELGKLLVANELDAVFVWCHNPVVTLPDSQRIRAGFERDDVFLCVHEQFLTETAELADVVLPAANFMEQTDVTRSFGHRVVQFGRAALDPPGEARGNVAAFREIGRKLGLAPEVWDKTDDGLCEELIDASRERLSDAERAVLLSGAPVKLGERKVANRGTPSGKIELRSTTAERPFATWIEDDDAGVGDPDEGAFRLVGAPSRSTHNSTFLHSARHRAKAGKPKCWMNGDDAREIGAASGGRVRLSNRRARVTLAVETTGDMPRGLVRVDGLFRAKDVPEGIGINALVGPALSEQALASTLYSTRVDIAPVED